MTSSESAVSPLFFSIQSIMQRKRHHPTIYLSLREQLHPQLFLSHGCRCNPHAPVRLLQQIAPVAALYYCYTCACHVPIFFSFSSNPHAFLRLARSIIMCWRWWSHLEIVFWLEMRITLKRLGRNRMNFRVFYILDLARLPSVKYSIMYEHILFVAKKILWFIRFNYRVLTLTNIFFLKTPLLGVTRN